LGAFLSLADLGIYNIGALFGTLPVVVARALANRVVMPLYRMKDPSESDQNRLQIRKARRLLVAVCMVVTFLLSYGGIFLVETLYDSRYLTAGPISALFGLVAVPLIALSGYDGALLARGDSRRFFILLAVTAVIQMTLMYFAVRDYGVIGAIASPAIAAFIAYPLRLRFLNRYKASDISGDIAFIASGFLINGIAVWWHWDTISQLITV
jgi:O-antigen/teichoic acid export membrane protein